MRVLICLIFAGVCGLLAACGEEPVDNKAVTSNQAATPVPPKTSANYPKDVSAGGVSVEILPQNPRAKDCLRAIIHGVPGSSLITWDVNGRQMNSGVSARFCSETLVRDDQVTVRVGTKDQGAAATATIVNSPPNILGLSSFPEGVVAGTDIVVSPLADDADGDMIDFSYQWAINGETDNQWTEATLPGDVLSKGDQVQVQIIPNDFFEDGPVYTSKMITISNAPPIVTSRPPETFTSYDYRYQVDVSDPDDSDFRFRLDQAPQDMTIDEKTGLIEWSLVDVPEGDYTIEIVVSDTDGSEVTQEYTLSLKFPQ